MKKVLGFVVGFLLMFCISTLTSARTMTTSQVTSTITSMKTIYNGKCWNGDLSESQLKSAIDKGYSNPGNSYSMADREKALGLTSKKCESPNSVSGGTCTSNCFGGAWQCMGFARYIEYVLFGTNIPTASSVSNGGTKNGFTKYQGSLLANITLQPGDYIRTSGHSAVIWKIENGKIYVVDAWGGKKSGCLINWGSFSGSSKGHTPSTLLNKIKNGGGHVIRPTAYIVSSTVTTPAPVAPTPKPTPKPVTSCSHSYNKRGYCSKCSKEYTISLTSMNATYETVKNDVPVRYRPYSPDTIIKYLSKGTKVTVVASGKNSVGNIWYKLNDGTWIYSGNLTKSSSGSSQTASSSTSIRFELESVPKGNLPYGKSFSLKGWFRSDCAIVEARAYILDSNKNIVMQSDKASSTTSNYKIQGYKLDKAMKFNKLSPGGYYLKYFVRDANGDTATWISDMFYIVK